MPALAWFVLVYCTNLLNPSTKSVTYHKLNASGMELPDSY